MSQTLSKDSCNQSKSGRSLTVKVSADEEIVLSPQRWVFVCRTSTLIVADIHLGRNRAGQRVGVPLSDDLLTSDLVRLQNCIQETAAKRVIILGDLFHETPGDELTFFLNWRRKCGATEVYLVRGNHDRVDPSHLEEHGIGVRSEICEGELLFSHDIGCSRREVFTISAHIHPGLRLSLPPRSSVRLPCFAYSTSGLVIPAFGSLTGLQLIDPRDYTTLYPFCNETIWSIPAEAL